MSSEPNFPPEYTSSVDELINGHKSTYIKCLNPVMVTTNYDTIGQYVKARQAHEKMELDYRQCKHILSEYNEELEHIGQQLKKPSVAAYGMRYPIKSRDCAILRKIHKELGPEMVNKFGIGLDLHERTIDCAMSFKS